MVCWLQALAVIDSLVLQGTETLDVRDKEAVAKRIKGAVSAKQHGLEDVLCPLIAEVGSSVGLLQSAPGTSIETCIPACTIRRAGLLRIQGGFWRADSRIHCGARASRTHIYAISLRCRAQYMRFCRHALLCARRTRPASMWTMCGW